MTLCALGAQAQKAQNRPYVDDKLFHFGFQLGVNFATFHVAESSIPVEFTDARTGQHMVDTVHSRVSTLLPGFMSVL